MSTPRKTRDPKPAVPVVRREPESRKRLPPELEAFARSEGMRLPRAPKPAPAPKLNDPRDSGLIPGVGNRDARLVADARIAELTKLIEARTTGDDDALARGLAEIVALGLWRGRSITAFDAFAEHVLGLDPAEAAALAERGRVALGLPEGRANEALIAMTMRTEAALRELGFGGRVSMSRDAQGRDHVVIDVPVASAPETLEAIGRRMAPLARDKRSPR